MKVSPADIADRFSILDLKMDRLPPDDAALVMAEHRAYLMAAQEEAIPVEALLRLKEINGKIWDLESDIRRGKEGHLEPSIEVKRMAYEDVLRLAEVGRRALLIRAFNAQRVAERCRIATVMGGFQEVKGDHASEVRKAA